MTEQPGRWKSPLKENRLEIDDATDGIFLCCGKKATEPGEALSIVEEVFQLGQNVLFLHRTRGRWAS